MWRTAGLLALAALLAAATAEAGGLAVAFRADAPPFSQRGEDGEFTGFIAALCKEAVNRAGYAIGEARPITAANRLEALRDPGLDLVCDSTTITIERAAATDFSPIIFIANSSYLQRPRPRILTEREIARSEECTRLHEENPSRQLVGVGIVGKTTANATYELARGQGRLGDTIEHALCRISVDSDAEGVAEVCGGFLTYYFGDVEIMVHEVESLGECEAKRATDFRAYEPYALAIPSQDDAFRRAFVSALYGLFTDGTATQLYRTAFRTETLPEPLRTLFGVNNLPKGQPATEAPAVQ